MRICFTDVFFCFFFLIFPSATTMRLPFSGTPERIFMKLLPDDSGENGVFNVVPKWGLYRPPNNFLGAQNWHRTYWCRRLANDSELVYSAVICTAVALKRHERLNAFNHDILSDLRLQRSHRIWVRIPTIAYNKNNLGQFLPRYTAFNIQDAAKTRNT